MQETDINVKNERVNRARNIDEIYVISAFKEASKQSGWIIEQGTTFEDYDGIDIKLMSPSGKETHIDVKRSSKKNANSPNFLVTVINGKERDQSTKNTDYLGFINDIDGKIYIVSHKDINELVKGLKQYPNKEGKKSKFVLIKKTKIQEKACRIINPSDELKQMLK